MDSYFRIQDDSFNNSIIQQGIINNCLIRLIDTKIKPVQPVRDIINNEEQTMNYYKCYYVNNREPFWGRRELKYKNMKT
jgi:hypothetical protein